MTSNMQLYLPYFSELGFFRAFTLEEMVGILGILRERRLAVREVLVHEGDAGQSCFFLVEGEIRVFTSKGKHSKDLATLKRGAIFGHLSLIDHGKRSATCTARGDALVLEMGWSEFDLMFNSGKPAAFKFIDALTRLLAQELRSTNDQLLAVFNSAAAAKKSEQEVDDELKAYLEEAAVNSAGFDLDQVEVEIPPGATKWGRSGGAPIAQIKL